MSGVIGYILSLNIRLFLPSLSAQPVRERQKAAMKRRGSNSRGKTHALGLASHRPAMLASCVSRLYRHPATLAPKVSPITPDKVSPITGSNPFRAKPKGVSSHTLIFQPFTAAPNCPDPARGSDVFHPLAWGRRRTDLELRLGFRCQGWPAHAPQAHHAAAGRFPDPGALSFATHSPILLACPGARLSSFDHIPVKRVRYEETDHYRIYRDFLENPARHTPVAPAEP